MPDLWVDVDAAVIVPVNLLPLLDDTDFKSIETAVLYNSAGLALTWNFATCAGVVTGVAVTPTTGGVYDWSEPVADRGMYVIEIPASGGASANNDTEGVGWFTGVATGVLPWRGPTIGFRRAALNDLLIDGGTASTNLEDFFDGTGYAGGTAKLTVDAVAISGDTAAADNCESMFDGTGYAGGTIKLAVDLVAILGTALTETAGLIAAAFKKFFNVANPTATCLSLADAPPGANGGVPTTNGTKLNQTVDLTAGQTIALPGAYDAAKTAAQAGDEMDLVDAPNATAVTAIQSGLATPGDAMTLTGAYDAAKTAAQAGDIPTAVDIAAAVGAGNPASESYAADGVLPTRDQAMLAILQLLSERSISRVTMTVKKLDGAATAMTFTLNDATTPTAITRVT